MGSGLAQIEGIAEGLSLGAFEGAREGTVEGNLDGEELGVILGFEEGDPEGSPEGASVEGVPVAPEHKMLLSLMDFVQNVCVVRKRIRQIQKCM